MMDIRRPRTRSLRSDIYNPTFEDLIKLALLRMYCIVEPHDQSPPPLLFPLAESTQWNFFSVDDWKEFGDLETEHGRFSYTLATYPDRGPPSACEAELQHLLRHESVLNSWRSSASRLKTRGYEALHNVTRRQSTRALEGSCTVKSDYITVPAAYEVSDSVSKTSLRIWKRSLAEISMQLADGRSTNTVDFLQIHAYLKDPIYGLEKPFKVQEFFFTHLMERFQSTKQAHTLHARDLERVAAQAAQESSYLINPLLSKMTCIHFHDHHQLPYIDISLDELARAEFSVPAHVLDVIEELILAAVAQHGQACPLIPILVTSRPGYSSADKYLTAIIDGNHRAAAAVLLRFLANYPLMEDYATMSPLLLEHCRKHRLGNKWQVDLLDVLRELYDRAGLRLCNILHAHYDLVREFAVVKYIPALLVQEEDFHTICKQRSVGRDKPVLLHPFHQTLFNDDELPFALPQKAGQAHGRPEAFSLLSLTPFGTARNDTQPTAKKMTVASEPKAIGKE